MRLLALLFLVVGCGEEARHDETSQGPIGQAPTTLEGPSKTEITTTMNGLGVGTCTFTNLGDAAETICGKVWVTRVDRTDLLTPIQTGEIAAQSPTLCSGVVNPKTTVNVDFSLPSVRSACLAPHQILGWSDVCLFEFVRESEESSFGEELNKNLERFKLIQQNRQETEQKKTQEANERRLERANELQKREAEAAQDELKRVRAAAEKREAEAQKQAAQKAEREKAAAELKKTEEQRRSAAKAALGGKKKGKVNVSGEINVGTYLLFRPVAAQELDAQNKRTRGCSSSKDVELGVKCILRLEDAEPFCRWVGQRLPGPEEWVRLIGKPYPWDPAWGGGRSFRAFRCVSP